MPGPRSKPYAIVNGVRVNGKTALKDKRLRSGQGAYRDKPEAKA